MFLLFIIIIFIFAIFIKQQNTPQFPHKRYHTSIAIENMIFSEIKIVIVVNTLVTFRNHDVIRHVIVCDDKSIPNSDLLHMYDTFSITFLKRGKYKLYSSLYKKMKPCFITVL
jgi:plastocyanin